MRRPGSTRSKHLAKHLAKRVLLAGGRQLRFAGAKHDEGGERVVSLPAGGRQLRFAGAIDGMAGRAPSAFGFPNERM